MKRKTILLINAEGVQTLCMAKSLRRLGFRVVGFCNHRCSSGYFTRYLSKRYKSPDITLSQPCFREFLFNYLRDNEVEMIIPLADDGARFLSENKEKYSQLYKELSELIGDAATLKLWEHYQGLNISFPKKLYSNEYVRNFVAENKGKMSTKDIAKAVGLSERRVRQILKEEK